MPPFQGMLRKDLVVDVDELMPHGSKCSQDIAGLSDESLDKQYADCVNKIFSWSHFRELKQQIRRQDLDPALSEMRRLSAAFDFPEKNFKVIHVAGTNGKGSVSLKVATSLE